MGLPIPSRLRQFLYHRHVCRDCMFHLIVFSNIFPSIKLLIRETEAAV
jgi:hypothetical protein